MDAVPPFYETADISTLMRDFLSFPKFDRSIVIVKNSKGLPSPSGEISKPLTAMYYIKPGKANSVKDSVMYITELFNEHSTVKIGEVNTTVYEVMKKCLEKTE